MNKLSWILLAALVPIWTVVLVFFFSWPTVILLGILTFAWIARILGDEVAGLRDMVSDLFE